MLKWFSSAMLVVWVVLRSAGIAVAGDYLIDEDFKAVEDKIDKQIENECGEEKPEDILGSKRIRCERQVELSFEKNGDIPGTAPHFEKHYAKLSDEELRKKIEEWMAQTKTAPSKFDRANGEWSFEMFYDMAELAKQELAKRGAAARREKMRSLGYPDWAD